MSVTAVIARSPWSLEAKNLEESLLQSAWWRNAVANRQLEDQALFDALASYQGDSSLGRDDAAGQIVHYVLDEQEFPDNLAVALPRASIRDNSLSARKRGAYAFRQSGDICLDFEFGIIDAYAAQEANDKYRNFITHSKNIIGGIIRELLTLGETTAGCLNVTNIDVVACGVCDQQYTKGALVFGADLVISHEGP